MNIKPIKLVVFEANIFLDVAFAASYQKDIVCILHTAFKVNEWAFLYKN